MKLKNFFLLLTKKINQSFMRLNRCLHIQSFQMHFQSCSISAERRTSPHQFSAFQWQLKLSPLTKLPKMQNIHTVAFQSNLDGQTIRRVLDTGNPRRPIPEGKVILLLVKIIGRLHVQNPCDRICLVLKAQAIVFAYAGIDRCCGKYRGTR